MPPASGWYLPAARGLTQIRRCASSGRAACSPSSAGSAPSQPSETTTTTAPRAMPRRPWTSRNSLTRQHACADLSGCGLRRSAQGLVGVPRRQCPGHPGQPGGHDERLGASAPDRPLQQVEVDARVGLHGPRHVGDEDDPPRPPPSLPVVPSHGVAAGVAGPAQGPPQVEAAACCGAGRSPNTSLRCRDPQRGHEPAQGGQLVGV